MMIEGFLKLEVDFGIPFSWIVDAFLFLLSRSVNVDPFLARGVPSGTVYTLGFWAVSLGTAEAFLFLVIRSVKMEPLLFGVGSSGTVEGFLSFLFLSTLWNSQKLYFKIYDEFMLVYKIRPNSLSPCFVRIFTWSRPTMWLRRLSFLDIRSCGRKRSCVEVPWTWAWAWTCFFGSGRSPMNLRMIHHTVSEAWW